MLPRLNDLPPQPSLLVAPARRRADLKAAGFARQFGDALRAADTAMAAAVLARALEAGLPAAAIHSRVMAPAMHRIGALWEADAITIADEHLATAICERMLLPLYARLQHPPIAERARVLLAGVEGERHALGLRMAADVLEGTGYDVIHLGVDVPTDALIDAIGRRAPDLVGLGVTMTTALGHLDEALHRIQSAHPDLPVLLGGQGIVARARSAGWPYVEHADELVRAVAQLLAAPPEMPVAPAGRPAVAVGFVSPAQQGIGTAEARLSHLVREAADVARVESQRARAIYDTAFRDPLTNLANQRAIERRLEGGVDAGEVLVMIEAEGLDAIVVEYGRVEGDVVLGELGEVLGAALRLGDFAARDAGGRFLIVLSSCTPAEARIAAERLRSTAETALAERGLTLSIGGSAGGGRDTAARAHDALTRAKQSGGNRVEIDE